MVPEPQPDFLIPGSDLNPTRTNTNLEPSLSLIIFLGHSGGFNEIGLQGRGGKMNVVVDHKFCFLKNVFCNFFLDIINKYVPSTLVKCKIC